MKRICILQLISTNTESPEQRGDLAIISDGDDIEHIDYHFRGQWFDSLGIYWRVWLNRFWPNIKRAIEHAWSPDNPDKWDPDKTGVLWGRQHHTLDMELFGPSWSAGRGWGVVELEGRTVTLTVKGGELAVSRLRLPGLSGVATVEGQATERNGDLILLGRHYQLHAGEGLVVGLDAYGQA